MTEDLLAHKRTGSSHRTKPAGTAWLERGLRVATAAALGVDSYVHAHDASFYDFPGGGVISQGNLFRIEAAAAALTILVLLTVRHSAAWLLAFAVATSALGALVLYRYVDVGVLGPLPNMYEPTWAVSGKVPAAWTEAAAVLTSATGIGHAVLGRAVLGRARRSALGNR